MRTATIGTALLASFAVAEMAVAEPQNLSGSSLHEAVAGKTVNLHTPVGTIPISYRANGTMIGIAKDMQAYTGQERDKGSWWVNGQQLCQRWETWLEARQHCFTLKLSGQTVQWRRSDGTTGVATIVAGDQRFPQQQVQPQQAQPPAQKAPTAQAGAIPAFTLPQPRAVRP